MIHTYKFVINVTPRAKKRPKVYRWSTVNPSLEDEKILADSVKQLDTYKLLKSPLDGIIRVKIKFFENPPKNTPKWKEKLMDMGYIRPVKKPDLDNYIKLLLDALNGIIWVDDRHIIEIHASKFYTLNTPRIELIVNQIPEIKHKKDAEDILAKINGLVDLDEFFPIETDTVKSLKND